MTDQLEAGQKAPSFTLKDASGAEVSSADFQGRDLIIYFYPKAGTPGCTTEACDFRDNLSSLQAAGYEVVGISPDSPESLQDFAEEEGLTFPLLSDPDNETAQAFGSYGEKTIQGKTIQGTLRSTFVMDAHGTLTHAEYDVDAQGHVAALRRKLGV